MRIPRIHRRLQLEVLEDRAVPATLVNPTTLTYQDIDGDAVTVKLSLPVLLSQAQANNVFLFDTGNVDGSNAVAQQLQTIDLALLNKSGLGLTITVAKNPFTGDGFANIGLIDSTGFNLGPVSIHGDLGQILAGAGSATTPALLALSVHSMGEFGTSTQGGANPSLFSQINGPLGSLNVATDVIGATVAVTGRLGTVSIGGSLEGRTGPLTGTISSTGNMGLVTIKGNLAGGDGDNSGSVISYNGKMAGVTVGGSVLGGTGQSSAVISANLNLGPVKIAGSLTGGNGDDSAQILSTSGSVGTVTVGGSVTGGAGAASAQIDSAGNMGLITIGKDFAGGIGSNSARVTATGSLAGLIVGGSLRGSAAGYTGTVFSINGNMGAVVIKGNLSGGAGGISGLVISGGTLTSVTVGGSVIGAAGNNSGEIGAAKTIGSVKITGSLVGGSGAYAGTVASSKRISSVVISGSETGGTGLLAGSVAADQDIGALTIKGNLQGTAANPVFITAVGQAVPGLGKDVAIGTLTILGRVEYANIQAGYDTFLHAVNADAQIGTVTVGGSWVASNLVAGVDAGPDGLFGTADDVAINEPSQDPTIKSRIGSVIIKGQALGTPSSTNNSDHFGIVAQQVGPIKIGLITFITPAVPYKGLALGSTGDFTSQVVA